MKNKIIFSVFQGEDLSQDWKAHLLVMPHFPGAIEIEGCYKGTTEKAIVVDTHHFHEVNTIAKLFNQESILCIENDGIARLYYPTKGKIETLGYFKRVAASNAVTKQNYSNINGKYYVVK